MSKSRAPVPKLNLDEVEEAPKTKPGSVDRKKIVARPPTLKLITDAIQHQNEKKGSTVQEIKKFIEVAHGYTPTNMVLKKAFAKGLKDGLIIRKDGKDAASLTGRYSAPKDKTKAAKPKAAKENQTTEESSPPAKAKKEKPDIKKKPSKKEEKTGKKDKEPKGEKGSKSNAVPDKAPAAKGKKSSVKKGQVSGGSSSDTEVVQQAKSKPRTATTGTRRRSKSEGEAKVVQKPSGDKAKAKGKGKVPPGGQRALRV